MMPDSAKKKKWMAENTITAAIKINRNQDPEIIEYYGGKVTGSDIRLALREYIKNHPKADQATDDDAKPFWEN